MNDETLITLKEASEVIFAKKVSPESLKVQWRKGNLSLSKIGRSYFASVADFKGLKAKCLVEAPVLASGSIGSEAPGQSSTDESAAALDSLMMKLDELKPPSANTSRRNTKSRIRQRRLLPTS